MIVAEAPRVRAWPPTAAREGVELSTAAVVAILTGAILGEFLIFAVVARGPSPTSRRTAPPPRSSTRRLVLPGALVAGLSLRPRARARLAPGGRARGRLANRWGTVPLGIFAAAGVVTVGLPNVSGRGLAFVGVVVLGLFLSALSEEILFRGFLLHGLTRRLGGRSAVLIGSALFASAHLPALTDEKQAAGEIAIALVVLFGFGVLMCRIRVATGSVWYATGVHTLWNFVTIGVVGWAYSSDDLPPAFVLLKIVPVVVGLVIAVRVARSPRTAPDGVPPMPLLEVGPRPAIPSAPPPARPDLPSAGPA